MRRCYRVCKMKAAIQSITWPPEYSGSRQVDVVRMVRSAASRPSGGDPGRPCRRAFEREMLFAGRQAGAAKIFHGARFGVQRRTSIGWRRLRTERWVVHFPLQPSFRQPELAAHHFDFQVQRGAGFLSGQPAEIPHLHQSGK